MKLAYLSVMAVFTALMFALPTPVDANTTESPNEKFFSLKELKSADKKALMPLEFIQASDDTSLAFRTYLPKEAKAVLIFYHGAGAHSGLSYNHIGADLRDEHDLAVYMPDLRGHGGSGGERGDAPSDEQVWADISSIVEHARAQHPNLAIFLGGHSGGAGLALNYSSWSERMPIEGYVFLAPYFGFRSETQYDKGKTDYQFSSVSVSKFIINSMSGGLFGGHAKAVQFHFPESVLEKNPEIVPFNTVNMSNSVTPFAPDTQLSQLKQFGLWIGSQDEAFDPVKVINFATVNKNETAKNQIVTVEGENHFSIILQASNFIGPWVLNAIN